MTKKLIVALIALITVASCKENSREVESTNTAEKEQISSLPSKHLSLENLNDFQQAEGGNWKIAGDIYADRKTANSLNPSDGTGILVNMPGTTKSNILTKLEHGDIDLEMDFLMPKGSSSGIFLQGRYEVQLNDSWLKDNLTAEDNGGISKSSSGSFTGKAPEAVASKAPGLWQHIKISFKAPRFDNTGKKVSDAQIVEVILNGVPVQQNVIVTGPTQASAFNDEKPVAPLMLQGNSGPVAFKNIQYKVYEAEPIVLKNINYKLFEGRHYELDSWQNLSPIKTGTTDTVSFELGEEDQVLVLEGEMEIPRDGDYLFRTSAGGPVWLVIDGKVVAENEGSRNFDRFFYGDTTLTKGKHSFKLAYSNSDESLVLQYEGPERPWTPLTTPASKRRTSEIEPLVLDVKNEPIIQRGFMIHHDIANPYAASIGIPGGVNYAYDLNTYGLLSIWHGDYIDVSNMWRERGEKQLEIPLGADLQLSGLPTVAALTDKDAAWPDSVSPDNSMYTNKGYKLQPNGLPAYFYTVNNVNVEDLLQPTTDKSGLTREISFTFNQPGKQVYCMLSSGSKIEKLPNGSYAVDDKNYYLEDIQAGVSPEIRKGSNGQYQLLLPVNSQAKNAKVKYSIIW